MFQVIYQIFDYVVSAFTMQKKSTAEITALTDTYIAQSTALQEKYESIRAGLEADTAMKTEQVAKANKIILVLLVLLIVLAAVKFLFSK